MIPEELIRMNQWVLWKYEFRGNGKPTKVPYMPDGRYASTTDRETWSSFTQILDVNGFDGIGIVFSPEDPYVGIDLDNCIEEGVIKPWAKAFIKKFNSYAEISPSGNGVKIWLKGKYPGTGTGKKKPYRDGEVEMYHERRYFTVTGKAILWAAQEINENQESIDGLYSTVLDPPVKIIANSIPTGGEAIKRCMAYIDKCPGAISGQGGHDRTFHVACICCRFGLDEANAKQVMIWYSDKKCNPSWSEREISHKIASAIKATRDDGSFGSFARETPRLEVASMNPEAVFDEYYQENEAIISGAIAPPPTPWPFFAQTNQAFIPGTVTCLYGAGGSRKTFYLMQLMNHMIEEGSTPAFLGLEMTRNEYIDRIIVQQTGMAGFLSLEWKKKNSETVRRVQKECESHFVEVLKYLTLSGKSLLKCEDVILWAEEINEDVAIAIIDPISFIDTDQIWNDHKRLVNALRRIAEEKKIGVIMSNHTTKGGDAMAGGSSLKTHTDATYHFFGKAKKEEDKKNVCAGTGIGRLEYNCDNFIEIEKGRKSKMPGAVFGFEFTDNFTFAECGYVVD